MREKKREGKKNLTPQISPDCSKTSAVQPRSDLNVSFHLSLPGFLSIHQQHHHHGKRKLLTPTAHLILITYPSHASNLIGSTRFCFSIHPSAHILTNNQNQGAKAASKRERNAKDAKGAGKSQLKSVRILYYLTTGHTGITPCLWHPCL